MATNHQPSFGDHVRNVAAVPFSDHPTSPLNSYRTYSFLSMHQGMGQGKPASPSGVSVPERSSAPKNVSELHIHCTRKSDGNIAYPNARVLHQSPLLSVEAKVLPDSFHWWRQMLGYLPHFRIVTKDLGCWLFSLIVIDGPLSFKTLPIQCARCECGLHSIALAFIRKIPMNSFGRLQLPVGFSAL